MRRTFLVVLLILGLCQGFWFEDRELLLYRLSDENHGLQESVASGGTLSSPRPALRFSQLFVSCRQQPAQIQSHRHITPQQTATALFFCAGRHSRHLDESITPEEWGITVSLFPRSDG